MDTPITVNQLLKNLQELKKKGYGDAVIFVADDEEGNGYHALWYLGEAAGEMSKDEKQIHKELNDDYDWAENENMAVYMG